MGGNIKYILKESELRAIIDNIVREELYEDDDKKKRGNYNPDDFTSDYSGGVRPAISPGLTPKDAVEALGGLVNRAAQAVPDRMVPGGVNNPTTPERTPENYNPSEPDNDGPVTNILDKDFYSLENLGKIGSAAAKSAWDWTKEKVNGFTSDIANRIRYGKPDLTGINCPNADAEENFDSVAAGQYLVRNVRFSSKDEADANDNYPSGWDIVPNALRAGGLRIPWENNPTSVDEYMNMLRGNGWHEISPGESGKRGDLAIIQEFTVKEGGRNVVYFEGGHIAMCVGKAKKTRDDETPLPLWYSHYPHFEASDIYSANPSAVHFFRYDNRVR